MFLSHSVMGWLTTFAGLCLVLGSTRLARHRGFAARRILIDGLLVLLAGACAATATFLILTLVVRPAWGYGWIVLGPLVVALCTSPCLVGGLYLGERIQRQSSAPFRIGAALLRDPPTPSRQEQLCFDT
jgi:hypothetical protein